MQRHETNMKLSNFCKLVFIFLCVCLRHKVYINVVRKIQDYRNAYAQPFAGYVLIGTRIQY